MNQNSITVLHVDDRPSFAEVTKLQLERINPSLSVRVEESPSAALDQLDRRSVDCIISDYDMPEMNGLDLLEEVRSEFPALPFILFTGKGSEEIAEEAINNGVDAYYRKATGKGQYSVIAQHINTLVEKQKAVLRLEYLEREKHISDGGVDTANYRSEHNSESISVQIVRELADQEDVDPVALSPPLYESINPDALDALLSHRPENHAQGIESLTFSHLGYSITVTGDGHVRLDE